jgi:hypothetical protein
MECVMRLNRLHNKYRRCTALALCRTMHQHPSTQPMQLQLAVAAHSVRRTYQYIPCL